MDTKKEGPGKDNGRPGDASGVKKPYATLDLKATEIKDPKAGADIKDTAKPAPGDTKPGQQQPGGAAAAAGAKAEPASAGVNKDEAGRKNEAKPAAATGKPGGQGAPAAKPGDKPADKVAGGRPAIVAPAAGRGRSGIGSLISHLVAGVVGGGLVLFGADAIGPQLGISTPTAELQDRLARLETATKAHTSQAEIAQKLAAAEAKLARLDELSKAVVSLSEAQARTTVETKSLLDKVAAQGNPSERIAKLEDTLATIASAAGTGQQSGGIPQLAAITGKVKDLEGTLAAQIAALRRGVNQEIDTRIAQTAEAAEAAKSGTQRIDRELAAVKTDAARLVQRVEGLKADTDRTGQTLRVVQEETGGLKSSVEALKGDYDARFKSVARPDDVSGAVAPLTHRLSALEQNLQGVVKSEQDRRATAERIVLALELNNLKRAIDRGQRFGAELAEVRKVAGDKVDLSVLDKYKDQGVPSGSDLLREFRGVAFKAIQADAEPADSSVMDRLIAGAKSVVQVRKTQPTAGDKSAEAVTARIEAALKDGNLRQALEESKALSPRALAPVQDWLNKLEARSAVDRVIAAVETDLKASLAGSTPAKPDKASN